MPLFLFILSLFFLRSKGTLIYYYIIGLFMNSLINLVLKRILQQPRPMDDIKSFNLAIKQGRYYVFNDGIIPLDIFGMPSGHAQMCLFSTVYMYLSLRDMNILYLYLFLSLITIIERVVFKYHTVLQVIIGAIIGSIFGYFMYSIAKQKIKGVIREKKDDYGPL
jgi:membrane-associated phospholipid phosphatase